jgi:hypothetical protein
MRTVDVYQLSGKLEMLLDPGVTAELRAQMARLAPKNGAYEAAQLVGEMARMVRADRP